MKNSNVLDLSLLQDQHELACEDMQQALQETFVDTNEMSTVDKANFLGVPTRRSFFRVGATTLLGSAVLAACSKKTKEPFVQTGATPTTADPKSTTTSTPGNAIQDVTLLKTAQSLENLLVEVYKTILDADVVTDATSTKILEAFQKHHVDHAALIATTVTRLGDSSYTEVNKYVKENIVDVALTAAKAATDKSSAYIKIALQLEDSAAQTYSLASGRLTTTTLRKASMSVGMIEARHVSVLRSILALQPVPFAFEKTTNAVPKAGWIQ